jgi:hypothetical protein
MNTMRSKVISFRVSDNVYQEFEQKCIDEGVSQTVKLRELVGDACHETVEESNTVNEARVEVIEVESEKLEKVTNTRVKSWFPFDFSPVLGKGR